jgi:hypothetical protein
MAALSPFRLQQEDGGERGGLQPSLSLSFSRSLSLPPPAVRVPTSTQVTGMIFLRRGAVTRPTKPTGRTLRGKQKIEKSNNRHAWAREEGHCRDGEKAVEGHSVALEEQREGRRKEQEGRQQSQDEGRVLERGHASNVQQMHQRVGDQMLATQVRTQPIPALKNFGTFGKALSIKVVALIAKKQGV